MCPILSDLLTGEKFEQLKSSQKFANSNNRIRYWNNAQKELRSKLAKDNNALLKNYKILTQIMAGQSAGVIVNKEYLRGMGFSYVIFNNWDQYAGKSYPCVYDFFIIPVDNYTVNIIRK